MKTQSRQNSILVGVVIHAFVSSFNERVDTRRKTGKGDDSKKVAQRPQAA